MALPFEMERARIVFERSLRITTSTLCGSCAWIDGSSFLTSSITWMVLARGCFMTIRLMGFWLPVLS